MTDEKAKRQPRALEVNAPCTLYVLGGFGFRKIEARRLSVKVEAYAQYPSAVRYEYVEQGKRKVQAFVQTYGPNLIVLAGRGHIDPPDPMKDTTDEQTTPGIRTSITRRTCFDRGWETEFDEHTRGYFEKAGDSLLADYRGFKTSEA